MITPAGTTTYQYDGIGRLTGVTDAHGRTTTWTYRPGDGALTQKTLPNGIYTTYQYDALGRRIRQTSYQPNGTVIVDFTNYTYNGRDQLTGYTSSLDGARTFTYDGLGRLLTDSLGSTRHIGRRYDAAGNRDWWYTQFWQSQAYYQRRQPVARLRRQLSERPDPIHLRRAGQPDGLHRQPAARYPTTRTATSPATASLTAGYGSDGLRAWRNNTSGSGNRYFIYDGASPVCEHGRQRRRARQQRLRPRRPGEPQRHLLPLRPTRQRLPALRRPGSLYEQRQLRRLGRPDHQPPTPSDPYGYKGQFGYYTDRDTGLILCTHRYYDPATGAG